VCLPSKAMTITKTELFKRKSHCNDRIPRKILENLSNKKEINRRSLSFRIRIPMKLIKESSERRNHRRNIRKIIVKMKARIISTNKDRPLLQIPNRTNRVNSLSKILNLTISNRYNKITFRET
jgi:hypothetical protein